jgi:iron complex transport system substrate-binding protein
MPKAFANSRLRIVSLVPSATSILLALGARKELVGVSKWCGAVANVGRRPVSGDCWSLDMSQVMQLHPNLLIGSVPFKTETVAQILQHPVAFLALNPRSLADIYGNIQFLGNLANRQREAKKLQHTMRKSFDAISRITRRATSVPRVYCEAWPNPRISSPPWVAELVSIAGGKMIVPSGQCVADEDVANARPDVIVLAWTATGTRAQAKRSYQIALWRDVPAIVNNRVVVISDELLNTPGPPLMQGAEALVRAIHPELRVP